MSAEAQAKVGNLLDLIVKAAENKKAKDIKVLDVQKISGLFDFLVIMSGESSPQIKALSREIGGAVKKTGLKGFSWEGEVSSGWTILDLGDIVVHIMSEKERAYYNIEEIWGKEAVVYHY